MPPEVEINQYICGMVAFYIYYCFVNADDMKGPAELLWHVIVGSVLALVWPISGLMITFDKIVKR